VPLHVSKDLPETSIAAIWAYVARLLTNLDNVRAARIDNLDVLLSTREPANDAKLLNLDALISSRASPADLANLDVPVSSRSTLTVAQVAALLANLDVAVSTRSTLTAAQVWALATRDLTRKVGSGLSFVFPAAAPFAAAINNLGWIVYAHRNYYPWEECSILFPEGEG